MTGERNSEGYHCCGSDDDDGGGDGSGGAAGDPLVPFVWNRHIRHPHIRHSHRHIRVMETFQSLDIDPPHGTLLIRRRRR